MRLRADRNLLLLVVAHQEEASLVGVVAKACGSRAGVDLDRPRRLRVHSRMEAQLEVAALRASGDRSEHADEVAVA